MSDTPRTDALKRKWSASEGARNSTCSPEAHEIYELADSLERELSLVEKDAARYRWLKKSAITNRLPHITQYPDDPEKYIQVWDKNGYHPRRLDAAIDAALQSEKGKE